MLPSLLLALGTVTAGHPAHIRPSVRPRTLQTTSYLTYHYENGRTGWNPNETALTVAAVASGGFGLKKVLPVDGNVLAQPLYVAGVQFQTGSQHNVLIVATEYNSVYAFDADTYALIWQRSFNNPGTGVLPETSSASHCNQIAPWIGISSTPVIDPVTHVIYVLAKTQQGTQRFANTLHAISMTTGQDVVRPVVVGTTATLYNKRQTAFNQRWQVNRVGLLEANGMVYVGFGSSCDINPSFVHGWLFAYDTRSLALRAAFNTTRDATSYFLGAIWQSTYAVAGDSLGQVYFATGNGAFDGNSTGGNWGDTALKMTPTLAVAGYFTPYDQEHLFDDDGDLGSGGVMLLPDGGGPHAHLAVTAGKEDAIYLLDRDNMGGYTPGGPNNILGEVPFSGSGSWGGPAYFSSGSNEYVYYALDGNALKAYSVQRGMIPTLTLAAQTANNFPGEGGTIPAVSSNGGADGIVWATSRPNNIHSEQIMLYAYKAGTLGQPIFQSAVEYWQNNGGAPFLTPTVVAGKVFVGGADAVSVFGL